MAVGALLAATLVAAFPQLAERVGAGAEAQIEQARVEQGIPGMTVALRSRDGSTWTRGFGLADVENEVPATADTSYRLASISKPMTAIVVMKLVEQGRFDLDAEVSTLVPEFPKKRWPLTSKLLLGHLGGIRHYGKPGENVQNKHYTDIVDAIGIFAADPLLHEPGTRYRYTTYGYNLLGAAAQKVAGERFEDLLRSLVFEPAGLVATRVDDAYAIIPHRAQGYRLVNGELRNSHPVDTSNKIPGGGLCGTPIDLVRFGVALLDEQLVTRETLESMWVAQRTAEGERTRYGLGFSLGTSDDGSRYVGHSGAQSRVQNLMRIWPDDGAVVVVMCNLQRAKLGSLVKRLGAALRAAK